mgnify:CR=1 FL=1
MRIVNVTPFDLVIDNYDGSFCNSTLTDIEGQKCFERIKYSEIANRRNGARLPESMYGTDGRLKIGQVFPVVKLTFEDGNYRHAQDDKRWSAIDNLVGIDDNEEIAILEKHMSVGETDTIEFKASAIHPANPEDASDHSYQCKEIIKQLVAIAMSSGHKGIVYVGVKDQNGKREVVGIENEFSQFAKGCTAELFQCHFLNMLKELTSESMLLSVSYKYLLYKGHTVLKLEVDHRGDIVFYKNRELYVRLGSAMHSITDNQAFVSFIRSYKRAN